MNTQVYLVKIHAYVCTMGKCQKTKLKSNQIFNWKGNILLQVLSLHPDAGWLHIGCDEVYQLGQCPICSQKLLQANTDPENAQGYQDGKTLFLQHVHRVGAYVKNQKNVIPIIWDDMLRTFPAHILQDSKLGEVVEPMVWVYVEDVDRFVDALTWTNYGEVFSHIWAASAYKGDCTILWTKASCSDS